LKTNGGAVGFVGSIASSGFSVELIVPNLVAKL
jgi:hypothetical protein